MSCKKLGTSESERAFLKQALHFYEHVRATAERLRTPSFQMTLELVDPEDKVKLTPGELRSGLTHHLAAYGGDSLLRQNIGGWRLMIAPLYHSHDGLPVDSEFPSHQFICVAPHSQDEQRRFGDHFGEAARKLKSRVAECA